MWTGGRIIFSYSLDCDAAWRTRVGRVRGWLGRQDVEITVLPTREGHWTITGAEPAAVEGCVDVDIGFTLATNLLPLRRLALAVGESADAPAAWLSFPNLRLERLEQRYRRLAPTRYEYRSPRTDYVATLEVNEVGFVTRYPDLWEMSALA